MPLRQARRTTSSSDICQPAYMVQTEAQAENGAVAGSLPQREPVLEVRDVSKSFASFRAVDGVSLQVFAGEVLGLIGENGAGKSTLLNILCGALQPDAGTVLLRGQPYAPRSYREAMMRGVLRVYQEPANVPTLTVRENMILGLEQMFARVGLISRRRVRPAVTEALNTLEGLVSPDQLMGTCDAHIQQAIEILRALFAGQTLGISEPLILLDEPTAALVGDELGVVFETMTRLRGKATFIFVSHRLQEITSECDRAYVMKDGIVVAEVGPSAAVDELHRLMVGRERSRDYYLVHEQNPPGDERVLDVEALSGARFRDVSFTLRAGEILGLAGVVGSGKEELGRVIGGAARRKAGTITVRGQHQRSDHPAARMRAGIGYVPHDRQHEGANPLLSVAGNISLASLGCPPIGRGPFISRRAERAAAARWIDDLGIRTRSADSLMSQLSGGNQQKAIIARVLQSGAGVLVLDNPTWGIDAGGKAEIYGLLRKLASAGSSIVLISDDMPELIGLSHRLMVMKDGVVTDVVNAPPEAKPREDELVREMV